MNFRPIAFIFLLLFSSSFIFAQQSLEDKLIELDRYIENKDTYVREKQMRVAELHARPFSYSTLYSLYDEYKSFKYDSAYFYAKELYRLAVQMADPVLVAESQSTIAFCYLSSGLFKEAADMIEGIDPDVLPLEKKLHYYDLCNRLYFDMADYSNVQDLWQEYVDKGTAYAETLMSLTSPDSKQWKYARAQVDIKHERFHECIDIYKDLLDNYDVTPHDRAMINSSIGGAYRFLGQLDSARFYLAEAAIWDIKSATKETTALYLLAELLCNGSEAERSYAYIHDALENADYYNARHRKLSINPILPVIEQARMDSISRQRNQMVMITVLCVLLVCLLVCASMIVLKQNRKLRRRSEQLSEASKIKDEYIGHSFYVNSEYIAELEELYKTINQKLVAKQYDDLRDMSKMSKMQKRRERMYESFDKCFLSIFPSFVSEYAKLFPEGDVDPASKTLTPEMRIFALIRMGISDSERISKFLNYSVHTIYTYKTRVKTKSIVSNEEFEKRVKSVEMEK